MNENTNQINAQDNSQFNKKIHTIPKQEPKVGIDTKNTFYDNIINAGLSSHLDIAEIESFTQVAQNRELIYSLLDTMCEDPMISAVLETYAEDATEYNDAGQIVWVESSESDISNYVSYLLDSMNIDKNIYKWVHSLCKYGDVYLRLYKESEYEDPIFDSTDMNKYTEKPTLNEDVKIVAYSKNDKYSNYIEMVSNPAEMFELTKHGKTHGYIKAGVNTNHRTNDMQQSVYMYNFKKKDVEIFDAKTFVHACLEDNSSRTQEEVNIFIDDDKALGETTDTSLSYGYSVKRGQSLLYNVFKIWRELMLLENSILLNRISKSSIVRIVGIEVGDMPKEKIGPHLQGIKQLIEQKAAINEGQSMSEYTNPGPIENNIYLPTHNGIGAITTQQVGGDVDVKSLADLDYFKNKFFGALRVPKQYFGDTDDAAGFSGGESLSLISSRYAKMVKRIQNTILQAITDAINLMLIDKGLYSYINKFTLRMQAPTTSEERDRRDNLTSKIAVVSDTMNLLADIENPITKLKMLKSLLSTVVTDSEIINLLQDEIDSLELDSEESGGSDFEDNDFDNIDNIPTDFSTGSEPRPSSRVSDFESPEEEPETSETSELPSPDDLGIDMTDSSSGEFD